MGAVRTCPQFLVVLRGPAGAGKSTLARAIRAAINEPVATGRPAAAIDTDLFNWEIVPGEPNKELVFRNVDTLTRNYLRYGYSVIVSGLIITSEEAGAMKRLRRFARRRDIVFLDFYCDLPQDLAIQRNRTRAKAVLEESVVRWWELAAADSQEIEWDLIRLDMRASLSQLTSQVLDTIELEDTRLRRRTRG